MPEGMDWEDFTSSPEGYDYNTLDKVRRSHDVRIYEDGEVVLLGPDSDKPVGSDAQDPEAPPNVDPNADGDGDTADDRAYVDIRRTDMLRVKRGSGFHWLQTYYHFDWPNQGCDFPDSRDKEFKTITWVVGEDTEDEQRGEVEIPLIESMVITSFTGTRIHPFGSEIQGQWVGKRFHFDNAGGGEGRDFIIKNVGEGVEVEVIKKMIVRASDGHTFIESRFWTGIWGDPKSDPDLYSESTRDTSGGGGNGGGGE
jgi:hypothetical protein